MTQATKNDFENYKLIHNFNHGTPLKSWIKEDNFINPYKNNWEALMDVISKIETKGFEVLIGRISCQVNEMLNRENPISSFVCGDISKKIDIVYDSIIQFIKHYNENK